jgi:hypothetical protein
VIGKGHANEHFLRRVSTVVPLHGQQLFSPAEATIMNQGPEFRMTSGTTVLSLLLFQSLRTYTFLCKDKYLVCNLLRIGLPTVRKSIVKSWIFCLE